MYTVSEYLGMLALAKRSEKTLILYKSVLIQYAKFLNVPLDQVHNYLLPENLIKYAASRNGKSEKGTKMHMSILHRYFSINGVGFDTLEMNILKAERREDQDDKPLTLPVILKMMDMGTPHTRAILSTLISTGMRAGECCQILLSDVNGDVIHIRPEIAKRRHGGDVYLTAETQDYLDLWLKTRPHYIEMGERKHAGLVASGHSKARDKNDQRLFACSYPTMRDLFSRLYEKVDGEKGKYRARCTLHSCRKYFRTHAVKTLPLDLVEKIMRHQGYLTSSYVRISDEESRKTFHSGEHSLYITRPDQRAVNTEIQMLIQERDTLKSTLEREIRVIREEQLLTQKHIKELMKKE